MNSLLCLLTGRFIGGVGYQIFVLSGIYQIYRKTESAFATGLIGLALFLPVLVAPLIFGHWADRTKNRAKAYLILQVTIAALGVSFLIPGALSSSVWILLGVCAYSFLRAGRTPFYYLLVQQASVQKSVPITKGKLAQWSTVSWQAPLIIGPFLFSILQSFGGQYFTTVLSAACFIASAVLTLPVLKLRTSNHYNTKPITPRPSLKELFKSHPIWLKASAIDVLVMGSLAFVTLMPFLISAVHEDPAKLGYLRTAISLGAFLCITLFELPFVVRNRKIFFGCSLFLASLFVLLLPATGSFMGLVGLSFAFGFCDGFSILYRDFLLFSLPKEAVGRASGVSQILNSASEDLGEFRAGFLASFLGAPTTIVASALLGGALSLYYVWTTKAHRPLSLPKSAVSKMTGT